MSSRRRPTGRTGRRERRYALRLFASTGGAIYAVTDVMPSGRSSPRRARSRGTVRAARAGQYLGLFERLHGLSTVALRFGNVYGPRQDVHGEAGVIAIFCGRLRGGEDLRVFGDGEQDPPMTSTSATSSRRSPRRRGRRDRRDQPRHRGGDLWFCASPSCCRCTRATSPIDFQPARMGEIQRCWSSTPAGPATSSAGALGGPGRRRPPGRPGRAGRRVVGRSGRVRTAGRSEPGRASTGTPAPCAGRCVRARHRAAPGCWPGRRVPRTLPAPDRAAGRGAGAWYRSQGSWGGARARRRVAPPATRWSPSGPRGRSPSRCTTCLP